jgi:hypothetical protein
VARLLRDKLRSGEGILGGCFCHWFEFLHGFRFYIELAFLPRQGDILFGLGMWIRSVDLADVPLKETHLFDKLS